MYAYVKFLDLPEGENTAVVPVIDIKQFDKDKLNRSTAYRINYKNVERSCQVLSLQETNSTFNDDNQRKKITILPTKYLIQSVTENTDDSRCNKKRKMKNIINLEEIKKRNLQVLSKHREIFYRKETSLLSNDSQFASSSKHISSRTTFESPFISANIVASCNESEKYENEDHLRIELDKFKEESIFLKYEINRLSDEKNNLDLKIIEIQDNYEKLLNNANKTIQELQNQLVEKNRELITIADMNDELLQELEKSCSQGVPIIESVSSLKKAEYTDEPVGAVCNGLIHLGFNEWISKNTYDMITYDYPTPVGFVNAMSMAVFGLETLKKSSVTGRKSNASKKDYGDLSKLDPKKVLAIKSILQHWLRNTCKMDEITVNDYTEKTKNYLSRNISNLKMGPRKNRLKKKKTEGDKEDKSEDLIDEHLLDQDSV